LLLSDVVKSLGDLQKEYLKLKNKIDSTPGNTVAASSTLSREAILSEVVIKHVKERFFNENFSIKNLATELEVSDTYLCTAFRRTRGMTINSFLTLTRLQEAKTLIRSTNMKLYEIAEETGFTNESYFAKVFRRYENQTPGDYREANVGK